VDQIHRVIVQLSGQPAREKNGDEDRCNDTKRMTVSCHYDGKKGQNLSSCVAHITLKRADRE
jgi:hypothetical protein